MSKLLLDDYPLVILPLLAKEIGLNEAVVLQQVHYWLTNAHLGKFDNGVHWIKNSIPAWQRDNFPFFSVDTVKRTLANLREAGFLQVRNDLNRNHTDRTLWYTIDYAKLQNASVQNALMDQGKIHRSLSETTTETTFSKEKKAQRKTNALRRQAAPSQIQIPDAPPGYIWITSSISTEKYIHLTTTERGKILCGAPLKHRTTDYQHTEATIPCPECLKAAEKPKAKMEQPPKEIKDCLAQICFGQATDLTPASWGLIVKAWNQMGKPTLEELKTLEDAWYKHDWRGKKGERPKPLQFAAERDSLKAKSVPPPKKTHYGVQLTGAQQELYAKYPILENFPAADWAWRVREQNFK